MRINRLHLENYRIHENLEIKFDKGINLLLGENGKGKSSILEAIGYALFNSGMRGAIKDAIQYGKKSGKVQVEFTGVDGEEYVVTKRLNTGKRTVYKKSNPELELQVNDERIRELCGIKGDIKNIYENIILAKQNEFISSFKAKPKDREDIFDKVFNTEIYRKIYDGYSKDVESEYKNRISIEENSIKNITEIIEDSQEVKEKLNFEIEREKEFDIYLKNLLAEVVEVKKTLNHINLTELEIEKINGNIKKSEESLKNITYQEDKIQKEIEETILAKKIADQNIDKYNKYIETSKIFENTKKEKKDLEKIKERQNILEKQLISLEKVKGDLNSKIELSKNSIENLKITSNEKKERVEFLTNEIERKNKNIKKYSIELEKNSPLLEILEKFEKDIETGEKTITAFKIQLQENEKNLNNDKKQQELLNRENLDEKIKKFQEIEKEKKEVEAEKEQNISLGRANQEAYKKLQSSICPFLNENCKNLSGKDIHKFFLSRKNHYIEVIQNKNLQLTQFEELLKDKNEIIEKKSILNRLNYDIELKEKNIEIEKIKLEKGEGKLENKKLEYENWKLKNSIKSREELLNKNTQLKTKIESENNQSDIEEREKILKVLNEDIKNIENLEERVKKILVEIDELSLKEKELKNSIKENIPILLKYQEVSDKIEKYEEILNSLKDSNELYLENYKKALEKEKLEIEKLQLRALFVEEEKLFSTYKLELKNREDKVSLFSKDNLEEKQIELDKKIAEIREQLGGINRDIKNLKEKLNKIEEHKGKIEEKKKVLEKLKMKLELTKIFREKIKSMGKEVSKNMLKEIEILATENFRKITGRGEKILWSNEDKDKYSVYLCGDKNTLTFEQLSGGEQVAVAISIRGAMSELFTESRFSIFDEPTNNLDSERRRSLADSIGEILKNLEQSIIVTHDDTFREMAQKVIEL